MSETTSEGLHRLAPQTGTGFTMARGQRLRVVDPMGEQVSDLVAFARDDKREWLSSGRSLDYANTIYLTTGHILYSNRSRPMFTIEADEVGRHDFLLTPCSIETFRIIYNHQGDHPSCFGNLAKNLVPLGIEPDEIPTTFNIFMELQFNSFYCQRPRPLAAPVQLHTPRLLQCCGFFSRPFSCAGTPTTKGITVVIIKSPPIQESYLEAQSLSIIG